MRRFLIRNKLAVSAKEAKTCMDDDATDSSGESSDNDSFHGEKR